MTIHTIQQRTPEWFDLRLKYPLTASEAQAIGTGGAGLETLVWEKMAERYSKQLKATYESEDIDRGVELEPLALQIYELSTGKSVKEVGFVTNPSISEVGGVSPDGWLADENGLIEIKCFQDKKHFKMMIERNKSGVFTIESKYIWQMQMQMLFTETDFVDFVAYNPNYKENLLTQRVYPDKDKQEAIKKGLEIGEKLIKEIEQYVNQEI